MADLNHQKQADDSSKCIVFGYIRWMESSLELSLIPPLVVHTCLAFYYEPEYFDKARPDCFKISDDKLQVENIDDWCGYQHTIYCAHSIDSMCNATIRWTFKMIAFTSHGIDCNVGFGLVSNFDCERRDFCSDEMDEDTPNYAIYAATGGWMFMNNRSLHGSGLSLQKDDTILCILNLETSTLSLKVNDEEPKTMFDDIIKGENVKYKMVIQLRSIRDCIALTDFSVTRK
eukprot:610672_1